MQALVLEEQNRLNLREFPLEESVGPNDVRIALRTVGICGSDIHYYLRGRIGSFVVEEPMILGHEAAGVIIETGRAVTNLTVGDRVCMEPGIPNPQSRATQLGLYNLDPAVRFWATPPVHGVIRPTVVHPAELTFKLPEHLSFAEGAMVEPLAVGMQAATKAAIKPGDLGLVIGAGPIGIVTALSALAAGCSQVLIADVQGPKLAIAEGLGPIIGVNVQEENLLDRVNELTANWGVDIVFECSGSARAAAEIFPLVRPGGTVVMVGMPEQPIPYDVVAANIKEVRVEHVFRYAHIYPRTIALLASGRIDVKPLITDTFGFTDSVRAFEFAAKMPATSVKAQIEIDEA